VITKSDDANAWERWLMLVSPMKIRGRLKA